ncbi:unnamed protein product, partial [Mesorhabditis spiculigera]
MGGEVIAMIFEGIIAMAVVSLNLFMVIVILRFRILREDVSLSLLLYLLISEGLFAAMMIAVCVYQIIIYQSGLDTVVVPQNWCLRTIFPPLMIWANLFIPYCDALIGVEKLLFVVAPSFYRTLSHHHVHRFMFCLVLLDVVVVAGFIVHWSQVENIKSSIVCSNSGYPALVLQTESAVNIVVLTFGALCYLPVIAQIKKFVSQARSNVSSTNRQFYANFVRAVKWTSNTV